MDYQSVIDHFGGLAKTARALGLPISTVSEWREGVPYGRQCEIMLRTDGALQADPIPQPVQEP